MTNGNEEAAKAMTDVAKALSGGLTSNYGPIANGMRAQAWSDGPTNVVDGLYAIAHAIERLADVLEPRE